MLILAAFGLLSAGNAFGASIGSCGLGVTDVTTLTGGTTCSLGELEFGDFVVSTGLIPGVISLNPGTNPGGTEDDNGVAWLNFEFNPQGGPGSYLFSYSVTANEGYEIFGLDAQWGTGSGLRELTEIGCLSQPLRGCQPEADELGSLFIDTDPTSDAPTAASFWFDGVGKLWVSKNLTIADSSSGVSDIFNSHHYRRDNDVPEVPEPATMLLFSTALLGLGFMRRKKS